MPPLEIIPVTTAMQLYDGAGWSQKFSPKLSDGTIFDMTGALSADITTQIDDRASVTILATHIAPITSADATGIVVSMDASQISAIADRTGDLPGNYKVVVNFAGGFTALAARGNLIVSYSPPF